MPAPPADRGWCRSEADFDFARCFSDTVRTVFGASKCVRCGPLLARSDGVATERGDVEQRRYCGRVCLCVQLMSLPYCAITVTYPYQTLLLRVQRHLRHWLSRSQAHRIISASESGPQPR
jgi:hypothetical protein